MTGISFILYILVFFIKKIFYLMNMKENILFDQNNIILNLIFFVKIFKIVLI